jgi:hypothetical protein
MTDPVPASAVRRVPLPPLEPLDAAARRRLHACLRSPSGRAIMKCLAGTDKPMTARKIADLAHVSTTSVRDQGFRAVRLGYAVESRVKVSGMPARAWRITERGRDYMIDELS